MPVLKPIDLSNVTSDFPLVPAGTYRLRIAALPTIGEGKGVNTKGQLEVSVRFVSADGEFVGSLFDRFYPEYPKAQFRWKQFLTALGMPEEIINGETEWDTDDLMDMEVTADVVVDPERPNPAGGTFPERNSIKKYHAQDGGIGSWAA